MKDKVIRLIHYSMIVICVLLVLSLLRNFSRTHQMQETLVEAEHSLEELKGKQSALKQDLSVIESDYYAEKEARNKLGLVKEDEILIVLPNDEILKKLSVRRKYIEDYELPSPNWKKWLELII